MKSQWTSGAWLKGHFAPIAYLSGNWISWIGVFLVTTATVFTLFLIPTIFQAHVTNPYEGILLFLALPSGFFAGLFLIPLGMFIRWRSEKRHGRYPHDFPPPDLSHPGLRRLIKFVAAVTVVNVILAGQFTYSAVSYMDSTTFCGKTCHNVMIPEYTAYENSPHARVECVSCHIGPGASWFVRSKLSGVRQVFAVMLNTYQRPIPTPVENLRPARETCEACHWPEKFGHDRINIFDHYAEDETNTLTESVLLMHIGGGEAIRGIHTAHLAPGVEIRYAHSDPERQKIPWVEYNGSNGEKRDYYAEGATRQSVQGLDVRVMDCIDCHNRPTHIFELPGPAVDQEMRFGRISSDLPYVRKQAAALLNAKYASREEALQKIPAELERFYQEKYPEVYASKKSEVTKAAAAVAGIYDRNVFPDMKITWGTYINNLGHQNFPGCFRCHDEREAASPNGAKLGRTLPQDCNTCHELLAYDEASPKILSELGLQQAKESK